MTKTAGHNVKELLFVETITIYDRREQKIGTTYSAKPDPVLAEYKRLKGMAVVDLRK